MKILVVQTAHLGDLALTVPLLRALAAGGADGSSSVTLVTTALGEELLGAQSWLDSIRVFSKRGSVGDGTWSVMRGLRDEGFDVAIAAQRSFRTGLFVRASRARERVGFAGAAGSWAYTARVGWDPGRHAAERYLALAGPVRDADSGHAQTTIDVEPAARERVAALLASRGADPARQRVCLAPGSRWGTKRWLPAGFAAVAKAITERGLEPVIVGSADERDLCRAVAREAGDVPVLAGETRLPELAALLADSRALVANDSGTGHLAAAVGTPVVTIFGPTARAFGYVPYRVAHRVVEHESLECRPCHAHGPERCPLGHFRCMGEIEPAQVTRALDSLLVRKA